MAPERNPTLQVAPQGCKYPTGFGLGCRVQGLGFRVEGLVFAGFSVGGLGSKEGNVVITEKKIEVIMAFRI